MKLRGSAYRLTATDFAKHRVHNLAEEIKMAETIKTGTVLIKDGAHLPEGLQVESEPCALGWRLVKNLDGNGLGQKIHEAG